MKDVQFEAWSPNNTQSVQDQDPPSQPSEFKLIPVPVSDGATDPMNIIEILKKVMFNAESSLSQ